MTITIPKLIEVVVDKNGHGSAIRIDGVELTTAIADSVVVSLPGRGELRTLTVDLFAEDIRIVNTEDVDHTHKPVQHRDGKEPWCNICKLNADRRLPRGRFAEAAVAGTDG